MDFNKDKVKSLRKEYDKAVKEGKDVFVFEGQELVTNYAKYLLEYLEPKFKI